MELLEAVACGAKVEIEEDNEKLLSLLREVQGGIPNEFQYAEDLVRALWSVLIKGASS